MIWVMNLVAMIVGYASMGLVLGITLLMIYFWLLGKAEMRRREKQQRSPAAGGYVRIRGSSLFSDKPCEIKVPTKVLEGCADSNPGLLSHKAHRYARRPHLRLVPGTEGHAHE